ncbi:DUF3027 domain-containing protein [Leekyejoonella antrihumi]|uniref:DUF3027 domain-containing protein n=1 Tax=Leekyejoonella antrihumi TaxID=1660198 RepID=A0A563DUY9_9MICO|nr:DUF3027 domain-containing protein [Leekyejoonella antrihumi]TWP33514.1 DUF3027 domain-containing protein [Leekyejoonella antrihumi]
MPTKAAARPKADKALVDAVDLAREAAVSIAEPGTVGDHVAAEMVGERLAMHYFQCTSKGYVGWLWSISLARAPRAKAVTVCEANLLPGDDAVLAPEWLPYAQRLAPGDIGAGDITPYLDDDPLLEQGFEATGDEDVDQLAFFELGLGRTRVLSAEGREQAAQRWYDGEHGPSAAVAAQAAKTCQTCGYYLPMPGVLRQVFGVCANEWSPSDGSVVSLDHGCGAHSELDVEPPKSEHVAAPVLDDLAVDVLPVDDHKNAAEADDQA